MNEESRLDQNLASINLGLMHFGFGYPLGDDQPTCVSCPFPEPYPFAGTQREHSVQPCKS